MYIVHVKVTDSPNKTGTDSYLLQNYSHHGDIYVLTVTIIKACLELLIDSRSLVNVFISAFCF